MSVQDPKIKDYLTTKEVADVCGVNRATVVRWIQNNDLYAERTLGGRYRICTKDLVALSNEKGIFLSPEKRKILTSSDAVSGEPETVKKDRSQNKKNKPSNGNILVIDDDVHFRKLIDEFLTTRGYKIILADNGYKGLDLILNDFTINMVILDLLLPGINGVETMRQIKTLRGDLPIIIASGFIEYHFPHGTNGLLSKNDSIMEKPFDLRELHSRCKKLLKH